MSSNLPADGMTASVPFGSGYRCHSCGAWVPQGSLHSCVGWNTTPVVQPQALLDMTGQRIAMALERIAAALEASPEPTEEGGS